MLKSRRITDAHNLPVYVESGELFGVTEETIITTNKVHGWRIRSIKNSLLSRILGGAKGVIVPHQYVKSIGDIMIISKAAVPAYESNEEETTTTIT